MATIKTESEKVSQTKNQFKNRTALVLGITGGFGQHVAMELLQQGWSINTIMRPGKSLSESLLPYYESNQLRVYVGDARHSEDVQQAAEDCSVLVYGLNIPYSKWVKQANELLEVSVKIAESLGLTLIFPGNVYNYDPMQSSLVNEKSPMTAPTIKGEIRIQMEQRLKLATKKGAKVLILRAGDFIGKNAQSTWMQFLLNKTKSGYKLSVPVSDTNLSHSWCYLPDLARYAVALIDQPSDSHPYQEFHIPGLRFSFNELGHEIEITTGKTVKQKPLPWWLYSCLSPFVPFLREIISMKYLWEHPLDLDGTKLEKVLPDFKTSSLSEALVGSELIETPEDISVQQTLTTE